MPRKHQPALTPTINTKPPPKPPRENPLTTASEYSPAPPSTQDPQWIYPPPPGIPSPAPGPDQTVSPASTQSPREPTARPYKTHARHRPQAQAPDKVRTDPPQRHDRRGCKRECHT